jgi:Ca2+-transporting ATPase
VSLAVAAVPEGLPAVVTVSLAIGLQRMVRRNALVRKLPSVETLGSVTVICSDKTGTLTRNEMTVQKLFLGGREIEVTGSGYAPKGEFSIEARALAPAEQADLRLAMTAAARCNSSRLVLNKTENWEIIGDPTEGALLVAARKAGIDDGPADRVLFEIPFDSERKAMSVVVKDSEGRVAMFTKGAPEVILSKCTRIRIDGTDAPLDESWRENILRANTEMAARALRVLGLAYSPKTEYAARDPWEAYEERDLVFLALAGMKDPPREEAKAAVAQCYEAGIRPIMITGDHPLTALAIARELGIARAGDRAATGREMDPWSDEQLAAEIEHLAVFARVTAEHKMRIVRAWKKRGQIVAMTGDGVNDAPAIKTADIGIAMGVTGTDVTKEAADMVLTDDNFVSIVSAVEEGRTIFDNIQRFVQYLLSCNSAEIMFMFFAALIGWPIPLIAIQILWVNLVTDGLPALALGLEPPEPDVMKRPPRPPREGVITRESGVRIVVHGLLIAGVSMIGFGWFYDASAEEETLPGARTVAFCVLAFSQIFYALACRSRFRTLPQVGFFTNPYLVGAVAVSGLFQLAVVTLPYARDVFDVATDFRWEWPLIIVLSLTPVTLIEVTKIIRSLLRMWRRQG